MLELVKENCFKLRANNPYKRLQMIEITLKGITGHIAGNNTAHFLYAKI